MYNPRVSSDHGDTCPVVESKTEEECSGAVATCWSRGVPDVDCPDFGLCCFDVSIPITRRFFSSFG